MNTQRKIILVMVIASVAIASVSIVILLGRNNVTPVSHPVPIPVPCDVNLDSSEGFNSSIVVVANASSPLFVLPPGGTGTIPFSAYSDIEITFNVSLSVGSLNENAFGTTFDIYPANFALKLGQRVSSVLTIKADKNAPSVFYLPGINIDTDKNEYPYYISGGWIELPALLVADFTPSCIYFVNGFEFEPPLVIPTPQYTPIPKLSFVPTINLSRGEKTMFIFSCPVQEDLNINATAPVGFSAEFSPVPLDVAFSYTTERKMYALTVTADANVNPGTYIVIMKGTLESYVFEGSFYVAVK